MVSFASMFGAVRHFVAPKSSIELTYDNADPIQTIDVDTLNPSAYAGQQSYANYQESVYDGSKFYGGLGATQLYEMDYWTLRARSTQMFTENLYARGLLRRLVVNEINTGLTPDCGPNAEILGMTDDAVADWNQKTEDHFNIWSKLATACDFKNMNTLGAIQRAARLESLIGGDVLVVQHISKATGLPKIQLVRGDKVQDPIGPLGKLPEGHYVTNGVEVDKEGRHVAFWIVQNDGTYKRLRAYGQRSGRLQAWLLYGTENREDDVRGQPFLSLILQSLKELDRYKDASLRKAVVNSMVAMFVTNPEGQISSLPVTGGAVSRTEISQISDTAPTQLNLNGMLPGAVFQELGKGQEPKVFNTEADVDFAPFEGAMLHAMAWANNVPPEILTLAFSSNYSASQAAINEFKIYLNLVWAQFGENFCTPIYSTWLLATTARGEITAPGLLESWRDPNAYLTYGAWTTVDWHGAIKPSTDSFKQARGSELQVKHGWSTNEREARINTGTSYSRNIKRIKRENELYVEAMRPMAEFKQEFGLNQEDNGTPEDISAALSDLQEFVAAAA